MALAFSRKYRPKKLDALLGQETNVEIIRNAAKQNRIGHAYLLYGARGTGKTTTARLIAKLLNCERRAADPKFREQGEPCNECRFCTGIDAGSSLDVIEIDAASNRGIDEIRNLKENVRTAPSAAGYKVYIIDEAHMLTGAAFNALLKTLEEPPAHAVFVLATTEFEKLPATITSRTQRFLFKKLPKKSIVSKLKSIRDAENLAIDDEALELIAAAGEGSVRDAESLLEQLSSFEERVTLESAERLTGRTGHRAIEKLAGFLVAGDKPGALASLSAATDEGHNMAQFTKDLVHHLRKLLALKVNPALEGVFTEDLTADELSTMKKLLPKTDPERVTALLKALIRAYSEMQYSPFATIPLEIAIVEALSLIA